jgi:hypothetical protein
MEFDHGAGGIMERRLNKTAGSHPDYFRTDGPKSRTTAETSRELKKIGILFCFDEFDFQTVFWNKTPAFCIRFY